MNIEEAKIKVYDLREELKSYVLKLKELQEKIEALNKFIRENGGDKRGKS